MHILANLQWQYRRNWSTSGERNIPFLFLFRIIIVETYAISDTSGLNLFIKSNALEKSTNNNIASRFFYTYSFDDVTDILNLWNNGLISTKVIIISLRFSQLQVGNY